MTTSLDDVPVHYIPCADCGRPLFHLTTWSCTGCRPHPQEKQ